LAQDELEKRNWKKGLRSEGGETEKVATVRGPNGEHEKGRLRFIRGIKADTGEA